MSEHRPPCEVDTNWGREAARRGAAIQCSCPLPPAQIDALADRLSGPLVRHIAGVPTSTEQRCIRCQRIIVSANLSESPIAFRRGTEVVMMDDFVMGTAEFFADNCSFSSNENAAASQSAPEATA